MPVVTCNYKFKTKSNMKKVTLILAGFTLLAFASCKEQKEEPDTVVIEKEVPAAAEEEADGTSLSIGSDGVEFSTKDGDNKTEIDINTDDKK